MADVCSQASKMQVVILAPGVNRIHGGIESHAIRLASLLRNAGLEVLVIDSTNALRRATLKQAILIVEGVRRFELLRLTLGGRRRFVKWFVFTHGSFVEHGNVARLFELGYRPPPLRLLARFVFDLLLIRRAMENFDLILTLSDRESGHLARVFPGLRSRLRAVGVPVSNPPTTPQSDIDKWRGVKPLVCSVSRIDRGKNVIGLIQAVAGTNARLVVAGQDIGDLSRVLAYVKEHGIKNFQYVGQISDDQKYALMRASSALALGSFVEGVPAAALEALSVGTPVVCTKFSYLNDMPGVFLCDPDPPSIRRAIAYATDAQALSGPLEHLLPNTQTQELVAEICEIGACRRQG